MTTTCTILRHAEKVRGGHFNPRLRHQDEPLSELGHQQAERLADYLAAQSIAALYVSAYQRTVQTIQPTAARLGLTPVLDERLNEIDNGCLDGMSDEQVQRDYPDVWQAFLSRDRDFRFPEGETGAEAMQRVAAFLEEMPVRHPDQHAVAVCHEGLVRILMCYVMGLPPYKRWNFSVSFGGITQLTYQPAYRSWKLLRFNHTL